jgi:rubrerythrin
MNEDKTTEILKNAILLEKRGQAFYGKVAQQATGSAVKQFFEMMAEEEVKHVRILSEQFKAYQNKNEFTAGDFKNEHGGSIAAKVLTDDLKKELSAADYEAAAISAAMSMEEKAIKLYSDRAAESDDPNEKAFYKWLADWEKQHLFFLSDINKEITEQIWNDNSFWPF